MRSIEVCLLSAGTARHEQLTEEVRRSALPQQSKAQGKHCFMAAPSNHGVTCYTSGLLHNSLQNDLGTQELPLVRGTSKHHSHACNWSIQCLMLHSDAQHFQTIPLIGSSNLIKRRSSGQLQDSVCPLWLRAEDCCHHAL